MDLTETEKNELFDEFKNKLGVEIKAEARAKIDEINTNLKDKFDRIDMIETKMNRLPIDTSGLPDDLKENKAREFNYEIKSAEDKAFFDTFLRKGQKFLMPDETKALLLASDPGAGYLAPTGFTREIIKGVAEWSPIRENAKVRPIAEKSMDFPKRTGQFTAGWTSEIAERTETEGLAYGMETFTPEEMYALVRLSLQQLEDSAFSLESELGVEFAERFGVLEGTSFITGDAVGKPEGILVNSDVGETESGTASVIVANDIMAFPYKIKRAYRKRAKWYMNDATIEAIRLLRADVAAAGDGLGPFLWQNSLVGAEPPRLGGYPVVSCPDMPDIAAGAWPVVFGDMKRAYQITDRIMMSIQRLSEKYAELGQVGFLARRRVDGQVILAEAIHKLKIKT